MPGAKRPARVLPLGRPYNRAFVGGAGRYIVFYFSAEKRIGIVDLVEGKGVRSVTFEEEPRIAVGRDKFVVCIPSKTEFVRYDLATGKPEYASIRPELGKVEAMFLGADSSGPILLRHRLGRRSGGDLETVALLDLTMPAQPSTKLVDLQDDLPWSEPAWYAAADGRLFSQVQRQLWIRLVGDKAIVSRPQPPSRMDGRLPDGDCEVLYGDYGAVTSDGTELDRTMLPARFATPSIYPAVRGPLVLRLDGSFGSRGGGGGGGAAADTGPMRADVFVRGDVRPQLERLEFGVSISERSSSDSNWTYDDPEPAVRERIFFAPQLKLLAVVPDSFDRVIIHEFDFDEEVKRRTDDYLFVYATVPAPVESGKPWSHQLDVRSKHGGLTYRIDQGPPGATVSPSGLVSWSPPAGPAATPQFVVVVRDATGREVTHTVRPRSGAATAPAAEYRIWTSTNGQFAITAALVELRGELVFLKSVDGRVMEVPIEKLMPDDQAQARSAGRKP